jgi:hypothetical protein
MTEDERQAEIDRLRTALNELCSPYQTDGTKPYDEVIKQMPETEQAMAVHMVSELEHLGAGDPAN